MKVFHCDHCGQLVFFENTACLNCGHLLAYLPDAVDLSAMEPSDSVLWKSLSKNGNRKWRLCANYSQENICNWAVPASDANPLCVSCRLTRVIPNLSFPENKSAWCRLETAKRRLIYTLLDMNLPIRTKVEDPVNGLAFAFLADADPVAAPVLSGHEDGVITINIAEADDSEREKRRNALSEPYRTVLGHFRHEIGHYYWDRLIRDSDRLNAFRAVFGDEQLDYTQALTRHYQNGPVANWQLNFVSAYASAHPWEDWAETWAHYLHMVDALETAMITGLSLRPRENGEPSVSRAKLKAGETGAFDQMIDAWFPLTYIINNLNRGLGLADGYPFVLSNPVIEKLRFVHETIALAPQQPKAPAMVSDAA
jgi:hypothetical protein